LVLYASCPTDSNLFAKTDEKNLKKFLTNDVFGDTIKKFRAELEIAMKQEQKPARNRPCTL